MRWVVRLGDLADVRMWLSVVVGLEVESHLALVDADNPNLVAPGSVLELLVLD